MPIINIKNSGGSSESANESSPDRERRSSRSHRTHRSLRSSSARTLDRSGSSKSTIIGGLIGAYGGRKIGNGDGLITFTCTLLGAVAARELNAYQKNQQTR